MALLHHPLCNLSILLFVNLTNFANLFHFYSFGVGLSKVKYSTACNFEFKSHFINFSTNLHLCEDLAKFEPTTN